MFRLIASSMLTLGLILVVILTMVSMYLLNIVLRGMSIFVLYGFELGNVIVPLLQANTMLVR